MDLYQREGGGRGTGIDVNGSLPKRGRPRGDWYGSLPKGGGGGSKYRCEWIFTKERQGESGGGGGGSGIDVNGSLPKRGKGGGGAELV